MKNRNTILIVLALSLALLPACTKEPAPIHPAQAYFDAAIRGGVPYFVAGVSGYDIRAYEIVTTAPDLVIVRVTYASRAGTDLVKTKRFSINAAKQLRAVEREDISQAIQDNVDAIARAAVRATRFNGKPMSWETIIEQGHLDPKKIISLEEEHYSQVSIEPDGQQGYRVTLNAPSGVFSASASR